MTVADIESAYSRIAGWWKALPDDEKGVILKESFPVRYAYNSGKIENEAVTLHDTKEIFANGRVVSYTGDLRTLYEIGNLKNAWEDALALVSSWSGLGVPTLLDIHRLLTVGTYDERRWLIGERPGTFKLNDYVVADDVGYPPEEAEKAVGELVAELADVLDAPDREAAPRRALTVSAYAHAKLVEIHPFADGNGRCARLLQNICLLRCGHAPLVIDERDRIAYYGALDAFHAEGDLKPFVDFCVVQTIKTWGDRV